MRASILDQLEDALDVIRGHVQDLREQHPDEIALLDQEIAELQARRDSLLAWTGNEPGDWALAREVARWRGLDSGRTWTKTNTEAWWAGEGPFSHAEMASTFGPDWPHVVALVRKGASLSSEQRSAYYASDSWDSTWSDAWRAVVVAGGPGVAARRALRAIGAVVAGVAVALARRHEIGVDGGISQAHYDRLTIAWSRMFGPVHPDDAAVS